MHCHSNERQNNNVNNTYICNTITSEMRANQANYSIMQQIINYNYQSKRKKIKCMKATLQMARNGTC